MKVILQQDVPGLGEEGDVCEVATGYARNFLFRTQAALPFTTHAMTLLEHRREGIERRKEEKRAGAAGLRPAAASADDGNEPRGAAEHHPASAVPASAR